MNKSTIENKKLNEAQVQALRQCNVGGSTGVIKRQPRYSGCIYFDKSLKETRHGRHIYHNKYCAEITINNVRYRHRNKSRSACEEFINEMRLKHSIT